MTLPSDRDYTHGYNRLLACAPDLEEYSLIPNNALSLGAGAPVFQELFEEYRKAIVEAAALAEQKWNERLSYSVETFGDGTDSAAKEFWIGQPGGPGADARVIELIRKYWLACMEANQTVTAEQAVRPADFLLVWLRSADEYDTLKTICYMPYWPIGLDEDGNWC